MLTALICLVLVTICHGQSVDRENCQTKTGGYGETVQCDSGYVGVGMCGSGRNADCQGSTYTGLECCPIVAAEAETARACEILEGSYGVDLACPPNMIVTGACSSGRNDDCGSGVYNRIICCDDTGLGVGSACEWTYEPVFGRMVECHATEVLRGYCGSATNAGCNGGTTSHGVLCCNYV